MLETFLAQKETILLKKDHQSYAAGHMGHPWLSIIETAEATSAISLLGQLYECNKNCQEDLNLGWQ